MRYIFDIETDGLLDTVSTIHCLILKDIDSGEIISYTDNWPEGVKRLEEADLIIGHNIIKYDIPVLKKLGTFNTQAQIKDTLVCTRLIWADIKQSDFNRTDFPRKLIGSHSLEAWGIALVTTKATTMVAGNTSVRRCGNTASKMSR